MAAASSAASTGIEPGERDGHRERDADEIIESKNILSRLHRPAAGDAAARGRCAVSRDIIEHGKGAVALRNNARCGVIMLVLARVGLSMPKMRT
jgi:hypothetical protein